MKIELSNFVIEYDKVTNNYIFTGGCFPGNKTYQTVPANLNILAPIPVTMPSFLYSNVELIIE